MNDKVLIAIPSYKRANKQKTFELLKSTGTLKNHDVLVFIYEDDPVLSKYMYNVGQYLYIIQRNRIETPNLRAKRNYILDYAAINKYRFVMMVDDDIDFIGRSYDFDGFIRDSILYFKMSNTLAMTSPAMNALRRVNKPAVELDVICHCTAMYDMKKIKHTRFPKDVKCEDNWISLELLRTGYSTARLNDYVIYNNDAKRDGMTTDGLSYMYTETGFDITTDLINRFPDLVAADVLYAKQNRVLAIDQEALMKWRKAHEK